MHSFTFEELTKMRVRGELAISQILPEKQTVFPNGKTGSYDFLVLTEDGKKIGMEVLTRPSKGKMKHKLMYSYNVDEYIFVIRANEFSFYKKPKTKVFHKEEFRKKFPKEFGNPKLKVWLLDTIQKKFEEKGKFAEVFNVEK